MLKKIFAASIALLLLTMNVLAQELPSVDEWTYLDSQAPGPCSALVYTLSGRPLRSETLNLLDKQLLSWQNSPPASVLDYETALLCLIKIGENPADYRGRNLLSSLYSANVLDAGGLDSVSGALLVYSASGQEIAQSQPNSPNALLDRMIASQQFSGGFAPQAGYDPDISVTARAIAALYPYQSTGSDVISTVEKALDWLMSQQNEDGTFSIKGLPSGSATAQVLLASSLYPNHVSNPKIEKNISISLDHFKNIDGGFSEVLGGPSSPDVTEIVLIAKHVAQTNHFPYYAAKPVPSDILLTAQEDVQPSTPQSDSKLLFYFRFLFSFIFIFFLVYLLLMITIKIGKFAEKKKLRGSLAAQARQQEENIETGQIHILMKPIIPNFDDCSAQELEIGHSDETKKKS